MIETMKKILSFVMVAAAVAMVSCGGNATKKAAEAEATTTEAAVECAAQCDSCTTECAAQCDSCTTEAPAEAAVEVK